MTFWTLWGAAAICIALYVGFRRYQAWQDYRCYGQRILSLLSRRDKHHLHLSRELGLSLSRLHKVLRRLERRRLVQGYWGPYVISPTRGPRYRFYRLVHRTPARVSAHSLASSIY
ncbi:MAG: hypothetical protein ACFB4J_10370 [Elainellaceae cyanobacterium]